MADYRFVPQAEDTIKKGTYLLQVIDGKTELSASGTEIWHIFGKVLLAKEHSNMDEVGKVVVFRVAWHPRTMWLVDKMMRSLYPEEAKRGGVLKGITASDQVGKVIWVEFEDYIDRDGQPASRPRAFRTPTKQDLADAEIEEIEQTEKEKEEGGGLEDDPEDPFSF